MMGGSGNRIALTFSSDGQNWGSATPVVTSTVTPNGDFGAVLPSVAIIPGSARPFCMMVNDYINGVHHIYFRRSTDGIHWSNTVAATDSDVVNYGYAKEITSPFTALPRFAFQPKWGYYGGHWYVTWVSTADQRTVYCYYNDTTDPYTLAPVGNWVYVTAFPGLLDVVETPNFHKNADGTLTYPLQIVYTSYKVNQGPHNTVQGNQLYSVTIDPYGGGG